MNVVRQAPLLCVRNRLFTEAPPKSRVRWLATQHTRYSTPVVQDGRPFRMAVLGSGPAGFYTAYQVMSKIENAVIDMFEHLPVPFGLVRFGVAPDHPEVKVDEVFSYLRFPNFLHKMCL